MAGNGTDGERVRLAELVAALSLGIDLGFGQPMEHVLRQCLIALRLAERIGLDEDERATVYYTSLLINVGCHTDAHEQAKWFGDDIVVKTTKSEREYARAWAAAAATPACSGPGILRSTAFRLGLEVRSIRAGSDMSGMVSPPTPTWPARSPRQLEALRRCSERRSADAYEQDKDGHGWPGRIGGDDVLPPAARLAQIAEFVEVANRVGGAQAAADVVRARQGNQFDPELAQIVCDQSETILSGLDSIVTWDAVIDAEPALAIVLSGDHVDIALLAIANFVDLKSPFTLGHAGAVADLAADTGTQLGLSEDEIRTLRRAGLVHDLGRLGISNAIWDKPGPLGAGEWERVRLHPYLTERMLRKSPSLLHHWRADRRPASRAARRLGVPAGALGLGDLAPRPHSRGCGRLPGDARAAAVP